MSNSLENAYVEEAKRCEINISKKRFLFVNNSLQQFHFFFFPFFPTPSAMPRASHATWPRTQPNSAAMTVTSATSTSSPRSQ